MVIRWLERRSFFAISNGPTLRGSLVEGSRIKLICKAQSKKRGEKKGDVSPYILSPALTQIRGYSIRIKRLIAVSMDSSVALSGRSINHADQTIADR